MYPHKNIDALFISHFDNDHVNGLTYLLDNTTIKYIFLPQLTDDNIIQTFVYNLISTGIIDNIANRLICNALPLSNNRDNPQIIKISNEEAQDDNEINNYNEINLDDNISIPEIINTGTKLTKTIGSLKWLYIPYNLQIVDNNNKITFKDYFKQELQISNELTIDNLFIEFKEIIKKSFKGEEAKFLTKCREIYKNYFKINKKPQKHNFYSMPLFSGHESTSTNNIYCVEPFYNSYYNYHFTYCDTPGNMIYMGDFYSNFADPIGDINTDNLIYFFDKRNLWDTIHNIQVPHHCSKYNFNQKLYKNTIYGIVSVSEKKRFGLPDTGTLAAIQSQNCNTLLVHCFICNSTKFRV